MTIAHLNSPYFFRGRLSTFTITNCTFEQMSSGFRPGVPVVPCGWALWSRYAAEGLWQ